MSNAAPIVTLLTEHSPVGEAEHRSFLLFADVALVAHLADKRGALMPDDLSARRQNGKGRPVQF